jgi:hypothetical protein
MLVAVAGRLIAPTSTAAAVHTFRTNLRRRFRREVLRCQPYTADLGAVGYDLEKAPAGWVMRRSNQREIRLWIGGAGVLLVGGLMIVLAIGHRLGVGVSLGILAVILVARPYANRYAAKHFRMLGGAIAEREVGETLNELLREPGWVVMHDIERQGEGNIDHLVSGPTGVYLIETKARRYLDAQLGKAMGQALKLHAELDVFVTPVICLHTRAGKPFKTKKKVWVVPRQELLSWIRAQHNEVVDFERLARFADKL